MSTTPVFYRDKTGKKGVGYDATILPQVADVYLKFRDSVLAEKKEVPSQYQHIIKAADLLIRGLANVGIVALVDEATGYQRDRATNALAQILEDFIAKELRPWVRTFPDEFYENLFRLRGIAFPTDTVKRPQYFGHLTNDLIYKRLAPGVLDELKRVSPRKEDGRLKHHFHRRLTGDLGHPKLREHLARVTTVMQLTEGADYKGFLKKLDKILPRWEDQPSLPFPDEPDEGI